MPNNTFSIGHDLSVDIYDNATGKIVTFPTITGFTAEAAMTQIVSAPLNGPPIYAENPAGWKGTIDFDRTDPSVDLYFANREAAYYKGKSQFAVSITETIREADGSITQFRYPNCALKPSQLGSWKANDKVTQRLDWVAGSRVQVI